MFLLPGVDHAYITVAEDDRFLTAARSDPATQLWERAQCQFGQDPGVDASTAEDVVVCDDVRTDDRWPNLQACWRLAGEVRSVLSPRLFLQQDTVDSLTLCSTAPDAFSGSEGHTVAATFAVHAVMAIQAAQDRLTAVVVASDSSREGDTAIGRLMTREKITGDTALDRLRCAGVVVRRDGRTRATPRHLHPAPHHLARPLDHQAARRSAVNPTAGSSALVKRCAGKRCSVIRMRVFRLPVACRPQVGARSTRH